MTVNTTTERAIVYGEIPTDKVTLAGNCGVGKTTLFSWFKTGRFVDVEDRRHNTDGEFKKAWNIGENTVTMTLFDTAGMECKNHRPSMAAIYFRRAKATMLVYDITDQESFDNLVKWEQEASKKTGTRGHDTMFVLVGNKLDLEDERAVSKQRALQFAENLGISEKFVYEISVKTEVGVREMFDDIAMAVNCIPSKPIARPHRPRCGKC